MSEFEGLAHQYGETAKKQDFQGLDNQFGAPPPTKFPDFQGLDQQYGEPPKKMEQVVNVNPPASESDSAVASATAGVVEASAVPVIQTRPSVEVSNASALAESKIKPSSRELTDDEILNNPIVQESIERRTQSRLTGDKTDTREITVPRMAQARKLAQEDEITRVRELQSRYYSLKSDAEIKQEWDTKRAESEQALQGQVGDPKKRAEDMDREDGKIYDPQAEQIPSNPSVEDYGKVYKEVQKIGAAQLGLPDVSVGLLEALAKGAKNPDLNDRASFVRLVRDIRQQGNQDFLKPVNVSGVAEQSQVATPTEIGQSAQAGEEEQPVVVAPTETPALKGQSVETGGASSNETEQQVEEMLSVQDERDARVADATADKLKQYMLDHDGNLPSDTELRQMKLESWKENPLDCAALADEILKEGVPIDIQRNEQFRSLIADAAINQENKGLSTQQVVKKVLQQFLENQEAEDLKKMEAESNITEEDDEVTSQMKQVESVFDQVKNNTELDDKSKQTLELIRHFIEEYRKLTADPEKSENSAMAAFVGVILTMLKNLGSQTASASTSSQQ